MNPGSSTGLRCQESLVPLLAGAGRRLHLIHVRGEREPTRGPVLLVHGAGVRANIFRAPVKETLVGALVNSGCWFLSYPELPAP